MPKRTVLLVDDDRLIIDLYAIALRERGFTVHTACDAATARAIAAQARPAVACVDGRLSTTSGIDLASELARDGIRVVIFTNDQTLYDHPPAGVSHRLIKVNTAPHQLAEELHRLFDRERVA